MTDDRQIREQFEGVSVEDAAQVLGISENAVRLRIHREVLESERIGNRRVVYLPVEMFPDDSQHAETDTENISEQSELLEQLRSENQHLRDELGERLADKDAEILRMADDIAARREAERELRVMLAQQSAQLIDMADKFQALPATTAPPQPSERAPSAADDSVPISHDQAAPEQPATLRRRLWRFLSGPA